MYFRLLVSYGYYRDNIVYRDNLKNAMKTYRDIAFSIIAQPYQLHKKHKKYHYVYIHYCS